MYFSILLKIKFTSPFSRSNDPTTWTETVIEFQLLEDGRHGTVKGHGTSLWRNMKISFTVTGFFDW